VKPKICAVITTDDEAAINAAAPIAELFEIRIDLIGENWPEIAGKLSKPWIATNRIAAEGGKWNGTENARLDELLKALDVGAAIIDLELATPNLSKMVHAVKKKARCLISHHDFNGTLPPEDLREIIRRQIAEGADICKLVTTARSIDDNLNLLRLYREFPGQKLVVFGMSESGILSRVLAPMAGAEFTYASLGIGQEAAPGQLSITQLAGIFGLLKI